MVKRTPTQWYVYRHECGAIAFFIDHKPKPMSIVRSDGVFWPTGEKVEAGHPARCPSCEQPLSFQSRRIEKSEVGPPPVPVRKGVPKKVARMGSAPRHLDWYAGLALAAALGWFLLTVWVFS